MGLVSDGGVHSGWEHIEACIELAAHEGVPDLVVHAFTDGRDTLPTAGAGYLARARALAAPRGADRDGRAAATTRWTATGAGSGPSSPTTRSSTPRACARRERRGGGRGARTSADETDEFMRPTVIGDYDGMADGDAVLHFNFRPDRARQLVRALGEPEFDEFARGDAPAGAA